MHGDEIHNNGRHYHRHPSPPLIFSSAFISAKPGIYFVLSPTATIYFSLLQHTFYLKPLKLGGKKPDIITVIKFPSLTTSTPHNNSKTHKTHSRKQKKKNKRSPPRIHNYHHHYLFLVCVLCVTCMQKL